MYYVLRIAGATNLILADFNLAVSTPTAKPPNLNPAKFSGYTVCICVSIVVCIFLLVGYHTPGLIGGQKSTYAHLQILK